MKHRYRNNKKRFVTFFLLVTLCLTQIHPIYADETENTIEIATVEEFLELAENCKLDVFSVGKTVELKADINLFGSGFTGIPYFNGTFHGNGHKVYGINIEAKGSQLGLFRYVGELGCVSDLNASGAVIPSGSQFEVGGLVGVNYGTVRDCYFEGTVCGIEAVGAIVGANKSTGQLLSCASNALVLATDFTGGIAGINEGIIEDCTSKSKVNIEELETVLDLGGIDIGTLNLTQNVVTRNNMGGIAGKSSGIISNCHNYGEIGYAHTGYNVGGIAGCQKGVILSCINEGKVCGRKDVGGIVGQAEPYVETEYLSDQIDQVKNDLDRMNRTLTSLTDSLESTSEDAKQYADAFANQYAAENDSLRDRLEQMDNAIPEDDPEKQQYMDNISDAQQRVQEILEANEDGSFSKEEREELLRQQKIIEENTKKLEELSKEETSDSDSVSDPEPMDTSNITGFIDSLNAGMDTINSSVKTLSDQVNATVDHIYEGTAVLRGEKDFISDVSSIKNASTMDGVISECVNRGIVDGDLNVGGIAGTMNIEYDEDPEVDFSASENANVAISSVVNDTILSCINYGKVNGKKNCLGSIVGLQEFGLVYNCEGYGHVTAKAGSYIGGIVGRSNGRIEKSYSMADLSGMDYIGGIVGEGSDLVSCISIQTFETEGECVGAIAGNLVKGGTVETNYFLKDVYDGIDNISYLGVAEPKTYEEIMAMEGIPDGFRTVSVTFEAEDEVVSEKSIPYGASLTEEDLPILDDKEDSYATWPEDAVYQAITNNVTIEATYVPWNQSAASEELVEEKPLFLAVANFYEDAKISLSSVEEGPKLDEKHSCLYAYEWTLVMEGGREYDMVEGHFYIPKESRDSVIEVWTVKENQWVPVETQWDGSYVVANIPFEVPFAVIETKEDHTLKNILIGATVLVLFIAVSGFVVHNKRKKKKVDTAA